LKLLALPRDVGAHPQDKTMITAGLGRFGPYIKHGATYRSLESTADLLTIGLNRAVDLLAQPARGRRAAAPTPTRQLGPHPDDGKRIAAGVGRYGPYVKHGSVYANLPRGQTVEEVTLAEAVSLINERVARKPSKGRKRARADKVAAAEAAAPAKA